MHAGPWKQTLATALTLSLVGGGFALGRATRAVPSSAASTIAAPEPPAAVPDAAAQTPRSFAPLAAERVARGRPHQGGLGREGRRAGRDPFGCRGRRSATACPVPGLPLPDAAARWRLAQHGTGSGFVIRKDGVVLTNNHVVENAKQITVTLERRPRARRQGRRARSEDRPRGPEGRGRQGTCPTAHLGDSDGLGVGDWVVAIGNPFGLSNTVTAGIVSAKGGAIGAGPYDDFIQTDAAINPGNSGGPLLNERGEVVGINTAIFSQSGGNIGIGFAIPINLAKELVPELEEHGHVTRGWLGVSIQKVTPELGAVARRGAEPTARWSPR